MKIKTEIISGNIILFRADGTSFGISATLKETFENVSLNNSIEDSKFWRDSTSTEIYHLVSRIVKDKEKEDLMIDFTKPAKEHHEMKHSEMTLRDYFAAETLNVLMPKQTMDVSDEASKLFFNRVARSSYLMADAMIKERNKSK